MPVEKMYISPLFVSMKQVKLNDIMKLYKYLQPDQVAPLLQPCYDAAPESKKNGLGLGV